MSNMATYSYDTLAVTGPTSGVVEVAINRPTKMNAMNNTFWNEMIECFAKIDQDSNVRVVILHQGSCRMFSAGLDIGALASDGGFSSNVDADDEEPDVGRVALRLSQHVQHIQKAISSVETCRKPVVVAVDGACIGAGVDLITACDIRYCTDQSYFCVKEVEVGLAADIGTLQRLPKIVGNDAIVRELALTARKMFAPEAVKLGLVVSSMKTKMDLLQQARATAERIASFSPLAVAATKISLNYSRDHTTQEGLDHIALMNSAFLQSPDLMQAMIASRSKSPGTFAKL